MRKLNKLELGVLIGAILATRVVHADELPAVTVQGYQYTVYSWLASLVDEYPTVVLGGAGAGGAYSANPTANTTCTTAALSRAQLRGFQSNPSQPNNISLNVPVRYANPIDIINGSPLGFDYGATNGAAGLMVFPNIADGTNAAIASATFYAGKGYSITELVNAWAPPSVPSNVNAMPNTLSDLGMTQSMANDTILKDLTSSQLLQVIGAFAWQEGYKLPGC